MAGPWRYLKMNLQNAFFLAMNVCMSFLHVIIVGVVEETRRQLSLKARLSFFFTAACF